MKLHICRSRFSLDGAGTFCLLFFTPAVWQGQTTRSSLFSKFLWDGCETNSTQKSSSPRQRQNEYMSNVRCLELLNQLQGSDLIRMAEFAAWRLKRAGHNTMSGEDIVQDALSAVLRGIDSIGRGRHPSPADLATQATFCNYLRGAINSVVEAKSRRYRRELMLSRVDNAAKFPNITEFTADSTPAREVQFKDLSEEFFRRLRHHAPAPLRSTLNAWEQVSTWADIIPLGNGCRRHRGELRRLAAKVMDEIYSEND